MQIKPSKRWWIGELVVVAAVGLAVISRLLLERYVGHMPQFITFYPAVVLVAMIYGGRAGVAITILSGLAADYFFIEPIYSFGSYSFADGVSLAIFTAAGLLVSLTAWRLHHSMAREAVAHARRQAAEEQASAATEIAHQKELMGVTLASIGDGVIVTDRQGCVTFLNGEAGRLTGWSAADAAGRPLQDVFRIISEHSRQPLEDPVGKVLHCGEVVGLANHTLLIARDGREIPIDDSGAPVRSSDGTIHGVVLVFRDFTEKRAAEESLQAAQRAADAARVAAESANAAKDRFLAVLSHELRTPLSAVIPALSAIRDQLSPQAAEYLEMARRNVELEARLIDDLLDVTRIARGKIELDQRPVELGMVLRLAAEVCRADIEARKLNFGISLEHQSLPVCADVARLQQVFWNLIKNSVKFTPHGGCVSVRARRESGRAVVEVSDSGEGIAPEAMSRIFDAFEQETRATTREFGGLGLGLAISKALVELHGGTIRGASEGKGRGATFTVELPLLEGAPKPLPDNVGDIPERTELGVARKLKVLLVEDHGDTAVVLSRLLTGLGHEVARAGDVATALEAADQQRFDVMISDLGLPDGSGHDLMRRLGEQGNRLPSVALSGYGMASDIQNSRDAGFNEHVTKPVDLRRLLAAMNRAVDAQSAKS